MIIISSSLTVPGQPSHQFHVEAWLPFRNREMDYLRVLIEAGHELRACHMSTGITTIHGCADSPPSLSPYFNYHHFHNHYYRNYDH